MVEVVPADAVAFLTFNGGAEYEAQLRELEKNDVYRMGVREFERMLGIPLSQARRPASISSAFDLGEVELRTAAFDGKVVVTIGQGAIAKLRDDGDKLADDEGFEDARDAAGMPAESVGFMWLDLEDGIPMVLGLSGASGATIPAKIRENLEPLGSFLAWADNDGRSGSFTAFLQID